MSETFCHCCEGISAITPEAIANRPALSAVAYRVGTYATFRETMLNAIATFPDEPEEWRQQAKAQLQSWTARASDDYGIALLEMWAYLADVLTFYQERIANEAYLNTAVFRESVLRLANMLDYSPANGMAASAYLALFLEKEETVAITPGLRVQSVPGQDETPQKFETMEELSAWIQLNEFRIYPLPKTDTPLVAGRSSATATSDISHLAKGKNIVIFDPVGGNPAAAVAKETGKVEHLAKKKEAVVAGLLEEKAASAATFEQAAAVDCASKLIHVEDKEVAGIQTVDWRTELAWKPAINCPFATGAKAYQWLRKFKLFGHDAPTTFVYLQKGTNPEGEEVLNWYTQTNYAYAAGGSATLLLDSVYDDLKENTELLIVARLDSGASALVKKVTVAAVDQVYEEVQYGVGGPILQGTVTQLTLSETLPDGLDVRSAVVYELAGPEIVFWEEKYDGTITGNTVYALLDELGIAEEDVPELLADGRRIIVQDDQGVVQSTTIDSTAVIAGSAVSGKTIKITLDESLAEDLETSTAVARANVVLVGHGETIADEVLGSGDASNEFQSFALSKSPVTYVPQAGADNGAASTLELRVDGIQWHEADTLYGQDGKAEKFTTSVDNDDLMHVKFGDGKNGARLPTGTNNVTATYRQGLGQDGNVAAETLLTLLDKPLGVKEVINPQAAEGGADRESLENIRDNAPNAVRTFGRIVSLRDFEDAARAYSGIAKARAVWEWVGLEQKVLLTVAGDEGAEITPGSETHKNLVADLNSRRDPHRPLQVQSYTPIPVVVEAAIKVDEDYSDDQVQAEALTVLESYFDFDNLDLGQPIHLSDLYQAIQNVEGVVAVDMNRLQFKYAADRSDHGADEAPVQSRLAIFATELATVESTTGDLSVTVGLSE